MHPLHRLSMGLIFFIPFGASAASFDCQKARSMTEKAICANPDLSKLDEELNSAYQRAISVAPDSSIVVQWQREWLKREVQVCKQSSCLKNAFSSRLALLQRVAPKGTGTATAAWNGAYIRYSNGKIDRDSASITLIGLNGEDVYIFGKALWYGANWKIGQINDGEIDGIGKFNQGHIKFDIDGCNGEMSRIGKTLVIENESGCGGLNVTFNGRYLQK